MYSFSLTNIGKIRKINQDYTKSAKNEYGDILMVVCDGLGGHNAGELASKIVGDHFIDAFCNLEKQLTIEEYVKWVKENINISNDRVVEESEKNPLYNGMSTTLALVLFSSNQILVANVGDSPIYIVKDESILKLSEDHTFINLMVKMGKMTLMEAENHPNRNVLMQAIGINKEIFPSIVSRTVTNIKAVVACTDGLLDMVDEDDFESILIKKDYTWESKGNILIDRANDMGGKDNITIGILVLEENHAK